MTPSAVKVLSWSIFAAAAGVLVAACYLKMQIYEFNRFLLLLIAVPPVMLGILMRVLRTETAASGKRQS